MRGRRAAPWHNFRDGPQEECSRRCEFIAGTALTLGLAKARARSSASLARLAWLITSRSQLTGGLFLQGL
jgi:hypothetical protein